MARIIEVTISPKGEITMQTKGYSGSNCIQASKFLEDALGVRKADQVTADYYQTEETRQQIEQ